jgi:hypothetical protein
VASCGRYGPERGGVDTDVVYADEGTTAVEFKLEEVDDIEDEICRNKSGDLATASHGIALLLKILPRSLTRLVGNQVGRGEEELSSFRFDTS